MAGRISKSGKKFGGRHTSYTQLAGKLVDYITKYSCVDKISAGIIKTNLPNQQGKYRIKIVDEGACLLVRVRGNISQQEVRVYSTNKQELQDLLHVFAQKNSIEITR